MNWLTIGKTILGGVASIGINNIVGNIVRATTPANLNTLNKVSIQVGTFVLSSVVSAQAIRHMNSEIDGFIEAVHPAKKEAPSQE